MAAVPVGREQDPDPPGWQCADTGRGPDSGGAAWTHPGLRLCPPKTAYPMSAVPGTHPPEISEATTTAPKYCQATCTCCAQEPNDPWGCTLLTIKCPSYVAREATNTWTSGTDKSSGRTKQLTILQPFSSSARHPALERECVEAFTQDAGSG